MKKFIASKRVNTKYDQIAEADVRAWKLPYEANAISQVLSVIYTKMGIFDRYKTTFVAKDVDLSKLDSGSEFVCKVDTENDYVAELRIYRAIVSTELSLDEL